MPALKIALVAENASKIMGGEAQKILVYLQKLRDRNHTVWLVCHGRVRQELKAVLPPEQFNNIQFVDDIRLQIVLWKIAQILPIRLRELLFGTIINIIFQLKAKKIVQELIEQEHIQVVFQPTPNSPLMPSALHDLGRPVVIGPLTGGMSFPPNFEIDSALTRNLISLSQRLAGIAHICMPGKLKADHILVANHKTRTILPKACRGTIHDNMLESGVDLSLWTLTEASGSSGIPKQRLEADPIRFVYTGRLVDWKGVSYLIDAFKQVSVELNAVLHIIGDGEMRQVLEEKVLALGIQDQVKFLGWMRHNELKNYLLSCDVFVMPSLRESGGNSILEAMAIGLPVIVADWGGPGLIVDSSCGIKVAPTTPADFTDGLGRAMNQLGQSAELRSRLGQGGLERIKAQHFDWDSKIDYIAGIFETLCSQEDERPTNHIPSPLPQVRSSPSVS